MKNMTVPVASAAAGIIGGVVLERRHRRPHKVLGIPIPGTASGMDGMAKEIKKAGKQFGKLASEDPVRPVAPPGRPPPTGAGT